MDLNQDQKTVAFALAFGAVVLTAGLLADWVGDQGDGPAVAASNGQPTLQKPDSGAAAAADEQPRPPPALDADVALQPLSEAPAAASDTAENAPVSDNAMAAAAAAEPELPAVVASAEPELAQAGAEAETAPEADDKAAAPADAGPKPDAETVPSAAGVALPGPVTDLLAAYPGDLLLVHFVLADDCPACAAARDWLAGMDAAYGDRGLRILVVGPADLAAPWVQIMRRSKTMVSVPDDATRVARAFWVQQRPATYLVAADGRRLFEAQGFDPARIGAYEDALRAAVPVEGR